ncbi:MAG: hypothetical protein QXO16_08525 [Archaeoglobaceae archaeon]
MGEKLAIFITLLGVSLTLSSVFLVDSKIFDGKFYNGAIVIRGYIAEHGGFEPKIVRVSVGCHEIVFIPLDISQGLAIDAINFDTGVVLPGEAKRFEICFNESGVYTFRNSVPSGPMTPFQIGYLVVEDVP